MKYRSRIEIKAPIAEVEAALRNPDAMKKWIPELKTYETVEGTTGSEGAKSKLVIMQGKRECAMTETILEMNPPESMKFYYEASGVQNWVTNRLIEISPNKTRWESESIFKFSGMMKIVGFFFKGAFPKETNKHMKSLKDYVENVVPETGV